MRLPNAERARVEREKITDYLLSTPNPGGRSKAAFFLSFGFSADSWEDLAEAVRLHGRSHEVVRTVETVHGPRYCVDGVIETPDGRNPRVRTVWQVDTGSDQPRFITAFPRRR